MKNILLKAIFLLASFSASSQEVPKFTFFPKAGELYYSLRIDTNIKASINFNPLDFSRSVYSDTFKCDVSQDLRITLEVFMRPTGVQPRFVTTFIDYKVKGDTLSIIGNGQTPVLSWEDAYTDPEVLFTKKDISYGSISGTGHYTFSDSVKGTSTSDVVGEHPTFKFLTTTTVDGVGKVTLPGGITYTNLSRVKIERKFSSRTSITYWYFKPGVNTFPVLEERDGSIFYNTTDIITSVPSHINSNDFFAYATSSNNILCNFTLNSPTQVVVTLINTSGKVMATLADIFQYSGAYQHSFATTGIPEGIYFLNYMNGNENIIQKIILYQK